MTVVYIDRVFVLNLMLDYLLLLSSARLAGIPLQRRRLLLCAAGGGLYAAAVFFPGGDLLAQPAVRVLAGLAMALAAYWPMRQRLRLTALFFLLSGTLGGLVLAVGLACGMAERLVSDVYYARIEWPVLVTSAVGLSILLELLFRQGARHGGGEVLKIHISLHGRHKDLLALHDTGNTLRDPVNRQPVLVAEERVLYDLWGEQITETIRSADTPEEAISQLHRQGIGGGFTLLPFKAVGTASGLLLAVRSDCIQVGKATYPRAWIALVQHTVSDGGTYQALWGGVKKGEEYDEAVDMAAPTDRQTPQAG